MSNAKTAQDVLSLGRAYQFQLHPVAMKKLVEYITNNSSAAPNPFWNDPAGQQRLLRELFASLQPLCVSSRMVTGEMAETVIGQQASKYRIARDSDLGDAVTVVPLSSIPQPWIDEVTGELTVLPSLSAESSAEAKQASSGGIVGVVDRLSAFRQRFFAAQRRCYSSGLFRKKINVKDPAVSDLPPLLMISSLDGIDSSTLVAVLGALVRRGDDLFVEDTRNSLKLSLRHLESTSLGFLGERFLVVLTGFYVNSVLVVHSIDAPPAETRERTQAFHGTTGPDLFGARPHNIDEAFTKETEAVQSLIVVFSNVFLDQPKTLEQLRLFFSEMTSRTERELSQACFVFVGSFCKTPVTLEDVAHLPEAVGGRAKYASLLESLGSTIAAVAPNVAQHAQFVLVPGPYDFTAVPGIIPFPPIPGVMLNGLRGKLKKVVSTSNPCRLRFFTREITIMRRDYLRAFQQAENDLHRTLRVPSASSPSAGSHDVSESRAPQLASFERIAKTIVDEAHLAPDALDTVAWKHDSALRLDILPHTLVVCDSTEQWECRYKGVHLVNPGSFSSNATFLWYTPADGESTVSSLA